MIYVKITGKIPQPKTPQQISKDLAIIAFNTVATLKERIQNRGKKTDGQLIKTKSKQKTGAYSKYYGKKRQEMGYQTTKIDLTITGDLMDRGLITAPTGVNEWSVGFSNDIQGDKADFLEQYFGDIFKLSSDEINLVTKI